MGKSIEHPLCQCDHVIMHAAEKPVARVTVLCPKLLSHLRHETAYRLTLYFPFATPTKSHRLPNMAGVAQRELCLPEVVEGTEPRAQKLSRLRRALTIKICLGQILRYLTMLLRM